MGTGIYLVLITAPAGEAAQRLADTLVREGLAACVNRVPTVHSTFRWKGAVQREPEDLLLVKLPGGKLEELKERLPRLHPYEVPELLAFEVSEGLASYLDWVRETVGEDEPSR